MTKVRTVIEVPDEWEFVTVRIPEKGDYVLGDGEPRMCPYPLDVQCVIVKKKIYRRPATQEDAGKMVFVSDASADNYHSAQQRLVGMTRGGWYVCESETGMIAKWRYASLEQSRG